MTTQRTHRGIYNDLSGLERRIHETLRDLERLDFRSNYQNADVDQYRDEHGRYLAATLSTLGTRLLVYTDALELPAAKQVVVKWIARWKPNHLERTEMWVTSETEGRESHPFNELARVLEAVMVLVAPEEAPQHEPLERNDRNRLEFALRSLAKLCRDRNVVPATEHDVQEVLHSHLSGVFPDYTKQLTIAKPLVSFRPDGGVISLKAAIECKFVAAAAEIGIALHGLTEDLSGYAGSEDWKHFYSVIYMTEAFATEGMISRALGQSGNAGSWTTISVTGAGSRGRRVKPASTTRGATANPVARRLARANERARLRSSTGRP